MNYTTPAIVAQAHADPAAATAAFWRPLREHSKRLARLGLRHARETLGWHDFAAAVKTESAEERSRRLADFRAFAKKLTERNDPEALAVDAARRAIATHGKERTQVDVSSARDADGVTLDAMGFAVVDHESGTSSWDAAGSRQYEREMAALVRERTGATHVFCSPRKLRATDGAPGAQPPLHGCHADFGPTFRDELAATLAGSEAAPQAVSVGLCKQLAGAGITAERLRASRVVMLNTWRNLGEAPVRRQPLALVDTRTVDAEDVAVIEMPPGVSSSFALRLSYARPSERHRWYWWPGLTRSEALLFKQFDSADARGCRMLHSAVHHPETPEDAEPRRSVELRMLLVFS